MKMPQSADQQSTVLAASCMSVLYRLLEYAQDILCSVQAVWVATVMATPCGSHSAPAVGAHVTTDKLAPCAQDAVDRGWLYTSHASHSTGVTDLQKLLLTALELAKALAYLHSMDIMHGDLTGGNVLLQSSATTPEDPRGFTVKACSLPLFPFSSRDEHLLLVFMNSDRSACSN